VVGYVSNELIEVEDLMHWKCRRWSVIEISCIRSLSIIHGLRLKSEGIVMVILLARCTGNIE